MPIPDFDALWDYPNPAATLAKFEAIRPDIERAADPTIPDEHLDGLLQLLTQIARAQCLLRDYPAANATLDRVDTILAAHPLTTLITPRARTLLERGRCFNDTMQSDAAVEKFHAAWELATAHGLDFYAVDAAHMLGVVCGRPKEFLLEWNERAMDLARKSPDLKAQRWVATLQNNIGWTYHDLGRYADALVLFEDALNRRIAQGKPGPIQMARYAVHKTQRLLGRVDEALAGQEKLSAECETAGAPDGYVYEEIGECLLTMGRRDEARPHFARAHALLSVDPWF
ncbi:MAG TPA: tetratricopeptide repeat protein, partial [Tepidisphaeraceae bacterium]|nr:tetratricopeptide repeat protein [Tepidisphaeraceae bacterium]